jgi:hypothetical protein
LRGLGYGHGGSRLAKDAGHGEDQVLAKQQPAAPSPSSESASAAGQPPGAAGGGAAGDGAGESILGAYTFVDDLAGRWMSEAARLKVLRQRRRELLGGSAVADEGGE